MHVCKVLAFLLLMGPFVSSAANETPRAFNGESEDAIEAYNECTRKYDRLCQGYASKTGVRARRAPQNDAPVIDGSVVYDRGDLILLLNPRPVPGWAEWVRVQVPINEAGATIGWMHHADVVLEADLRQVIGCWPVASINWHQEEAGEVPEKDIRLRFTPEGQVFELGIGDEPVPTTHAIYYARGIFRIRDLSEYGLDYDIIGLLFPDEHRVELHSDLGEFLDPPYTMVDRKKLSGCKDVPVLKPKPPRITKKK